MGLPHGCVTNEKLASFRIYPKQTTSYNLAQSDSWLEIYRVWLKLISDSTYQVIPVSTRQRIRMILVKQLLREYLKSIFLSKWHRCGAIKDLIIQCVSMKMSRKIANRII